MDLARLIIDSRRYLYEFDYDHYPVNFEAFGRCAGPFFDELEEGDLGSKAEALSDAVDNEVMALPKRERKAASEEAKRVLALFFSPSALKRGGRAAEFAGILCSTWNERHRRNAYSVGDYDTILKGFDSNILGITLRKSEKIRGKKDEDICRL